MISIWLPWTPSIGLAYFISSFLDLVQAVKCGKFWLWGYTVLSYRNHLYVVVHSGLYSKLKQDFCACGCISNTHTSDYFLNFGRLAALSHDSKTGLWARCVSIPLSLFIYYIPVFYSSECLLHVLKLYFSLRHSPCCPSCF